MKVIIVAVALGIVFMVAGCDSQPPFVLTKQLS